MGLHDGVNAAGLESANTKIPGKEGTEYIAPKEDQFAYYKDRGLTHIRVPFLWERLQPVLFGPLDATYLGYLTDAAGFAAALDVTILLDLHNYGEYFGKRIGTATVPTNALADVWSRLATVFVGHAGV